MDNEIAKNILGLLKKRKDLLGEMLLTTQSTDLSKGVASSSDYISMIESREKLLNEVTDIDKKLSEPPLNETLLAGNEKFQDEARRISGESKAIASQIINLDKSNMPAVKSITDGIKKNLRGIKAGKAVNMHYSYDKTYSSSNYFDKSK